MTECDTAKKTNYQGEGWQINVGSTDQLDGSTSTPEEVTSTHAAFITASDERLRLDLCLPLQCVTLEPFSVLYQRTGRKTVKQRKRNTFGLFLTQVGVLSHLGRDTISCSLGLWWGETPHIAVQLPRCQEKYSPSCHSDTFWRRGVEDVGVEVALEV